MLFIKEVPEQESEAIKTMLKKLGINRPIALTRGEVKLYDIGTRRLKKIQSLLTENGYTLATNKKEILSEKVKLIIEKMMEEGHMPVVNISVHISKEVGHNYSYLTDVFSEVNGLTIEQFIIRSRVAKAKKLMKETNAVMGEIASMLHYKSNAHFSTQFKNVTGITPSEYKKKIMNRRLLLQHE